jgi:diketogulonate reductase-like aldo/keto reductase
MDKVIVLRNGVRVPMIGFGTSTTINKDILKDEIRVVESIKCALNIGYRHIDTANFYKNEYLVARAIKVFFFVEILVNEIIKQK